MSYNVWAPVVCKCSIISRLCEAVHFALIVWVQITIGILNSEMLLSWSVYRCLFVQLNYSVFMAVACWKCYWNNMQLVLLMHVCNNVMVNQRFVNNMAKNMIDTSALVFIQVIEDTLNNYSSWWRSLSAISHCWGVCSLPHIQGCVFISNFHTTILEFNGRKCDAFSTFVSLWFSLLLTIKDKIMYMPIKINLIPYN